MMGVLSVGIGREQPALLSRRLNHPGEVQGVSAAFHRTHCYQSAEYSDERLNMPVDRPVGAARGLLTAPPDGILQL